MKTSALLFASTLFGVFLASIPEMSPGIAALIAVAASWPAAFFANRVSQGRRAWKSSAVFATAVSMFSVGFILYYCSGEEVNYGKSIGAAIIIAVIAGLLGDERIIEILRKRVDKKLENQDDQK